MGGTSIEYLQGRLRAAGRDDLLAAIEGGLISTYCAAEAAGIVRRRPTAGLQTNMAKARAWALHKITGGPAPTGDDFPAVPLSPAKAEARRLAQVYADRGVEALEDERRSRRRAARRDPGHDQGEREADRVEPEVKVEPPAARVVAVPITPELPCLSCSSWAATLAVREIAATYVAARKGEPVARANVT